MAYGTHDENHDRLIGSLVEKSVTFDSALPRLWDQAFGWRGCLFNPYEAR